jgi:hypothetical protein
MPRLKISALTAEISAKWNAMSADERVEATEDALQELKDQKEMRSFALQNVPIHAFHDVRATFDSMKKEVRMLRTIVY